MHKILIGIGIFLTAYVTSAVATVALRKIKEKKSKDDLI